MKRRKEILALLATTFIPKIALAAKSTQENLQSLDRSIGQNLGGDVAIDAAISSVLDRAPYFLTALAFGAFLYSGAMYVFAMGDSTKMENAKKSMTWTVYGMIAMSMVVVVIKLIALFAAQTGRVPDGEIFFR